MEHSQSEIVILCVEGAHHKNIFAALTPIYFPRNLLEEKNARWHLPNNIGGKFGEPQYPDRQIRIIRNPHHSIMMGKLIIITQHNSLSSAYEHNNNH